MNNKIALPFLFYRLLCDNSAHLGSKIMNSKQLSVCCLALFAATASALLTGCGKEEAPQAGPPEVLVIEAATKDVPVYREWIGTIDGSENADVRARVEGHLIK